MINVKSTENLNIVNPFIKQQPDKTTLINKLEDATTASSPIYHLSDLNGQDREWILRHTLNKSFYMHHASQSHNVPTTPKIALSQKGYNFGHTLQNVLKEDLTYETQKGEIRIKKGITAKFIDSCFNIVSTSDDPNEVRIYNYEKGVWEITDLPLQRFIYELCHTLETSWSKNLENALLDQIKRRIKVYEPSEFNQEALTLENGAFNYNTLKIEPRSPLHLSTIKSHVKYNPKAKAPVFQQSLREWFDDKDDIAFVQEWFGYVLSNEFKANAFLLVYSQGGEGKSTLFGLLEHIVGIPNTTAISLSNFNQSFGLEPLLHKKLNLATESSNTEFSTDKLKAITAGEKITVNRKGLKEIETVISAKMTFLLNDLPVFKDKSNGLQRRLLILPMTKPIPLSSQNKNLPQQLEKELSGIFNWALDGLRRLDQNDYQFTTSKSMNVIKQKYFNAISPMMDFIRNCLDINSNNSNILGNELIATFKSWSEMHNYNVTHLLSPIAFWREFSVEMQKLGINYTKTKSSGKTIVKGIKFKSDSSDDSDVKND
ncbi:DNA primase family protein [Staphylococcus hominis]|uniref:DNA primase family protein n=1 Tax=Staphylococcus hominis TaxID=1290 RepID=UPI002DD62011|nr:phage/plasmid primase, P4 family [Staphylococcus hominis]WRY65727.1 phage/plasmid primase, P4 family [Staphylococcus hominis]